MAFPRWFGVFGVGLLTLSIGTFALAEGKASDDPCDPAFVPPKKGPIPTCPTSRPVEVVAGSKPFREPPSPPPERDRRGKLAEGAPIVSAPGFQLLPQGGSRVFVQVYGKVPISQHASRGAVVFVMKDARVTLRNNRNPLLTGFFNTPVADAHLARAGKDVHLVIRMRAAATPQPRVIELVPGKLIMLEVDFPAGSYYEGEAPDPPRGRTRVTGSGEVVRAPPPSQRHEAPTRSKPPETVLGPPTP